MKQTFTKKAFTIAIVFTLFVLAVLLFVNAIDALLLLFAAILLAVFLRGLADWLSEKTKFGKGFSLAMVTLALIFSFGGLIYLLAPDVAEQVKQLRTELPQSINGLRTKVEQYNWGRALLAQLPQSDELIDALQNTSLLSRAGGFFSTTLGIFTKLGIFLLLGIYLAAEPTIYRQGFLKLVPIPRRERVAKIVDEIGETLRWWLVGKFGSMIVIGLLTSIGLWILGVPLALALGIITALLTFIPNIGPILSVIPAALLAFSQEPIRAVYVILLYVGVQVIESNLITPWIERRTIQLPPALTISMQLILSVFVGGLGLILATPLVAVGLVLVQMLYIEDVLGDDMKMPLEQKHEAESEKETEIPENKKDETD